MFNHDIYILGESNPFEIDTQEEVTINLELEKAPFGYYTILTGKVLYRNMPIRNATVMILDDTDSPLITAITDEHGIYKFSNVVKPGIYKVITSAIGYNTSDIKTIQINHHEVTKLSFTLKKSLIYVNGIVYGKILEAGSREPIEDANIYLKAIDTNETIYITMSNHNGQYLIYNIFPNNYNLIIQKRGYLSMEPYFIKVEKFDRICYYFDLIKEPCTDKNTISGFITCNETPISQAAVFLYCIDTDNNEKLVQIQETNESGFFLFTNVESGNYLVKGKQQNHMIYEKSFLIE